MFVVCGEALFDVFATGRTPSGFALDGRMGGSPFNVALGLARLGQPVQFCGGIGTDFAGDRLMQALADEGVGTTGVARLDAPTTLSLVGLDGRGVPSYAFHGTGAADRLLLPAHLAAVPTGAACLHLGSFAMVVEPTAGTLRALVERQRGRCVVSYDPNVRPSIEPDLALWRRTVQWMLPRTQLLKLSEEDLARLSPGTSAARFAADALDAGVALVVVTRGADGAQAFSGEWVIEAPAETVAVVDTVGAGDAFQAALLAGLAEQALLTPDRLGRLGRDEAMEALRFAAHAAAVTCTRQGADLPRRHELA